MHWDVSKKDSKMKLQYESLISSILVTDRDHHILLNSSISPPQNLSGDFH
jgi:hypothetical protein